MTPKILLPKTNFLIREIQTTNITGNYSDHQNNKFQTFFSAKTVKKNNQISCSMFLCGDICRFSLSYIILKWLSLGFGLVGEVKEIFKCVNLVIWSVVWRGDKHTKKEQNALFKSCFLQMYDFIILNNMSSVFLFSCKSTTYNHLQINH